MKYYFKLGLNSRIIYPGDFFIGLDNLNHTYYDIATMNKIDREKIGVYELDEDFKYFKDSRVKQSYTDSQIDDLRDVRILTRFKYRNDFYNCGVRDIALVNTILSLTSQSSDTIGNLHWYDEHIPFYITTYKGYIRNMDLPTFRDFAKHMTAHVLAYNRAAEILKLRCSTGEQVDIHARDNWPTENIIEDYALFSQKLIDYTYGSIEPIDEDYQNQIDSLASMIE
jgi:hypothetical protein